jgi:hypothetical protein
MQKKSARYQGYVFDIFESNEPVGGWKIHVWPPNRQPPVIIPPQASENEAIKEAISTVDYLMHSGRQQAA